MIESSLNEALEEIIRLSTNKQNQNIIEINLNCNDEFAEIKIVYENNIPLNPLNIDDYELPCASSNIDNLAIDALWLHLIRKQMDRVYFKKAGSKRIFQFVKYKRDGAPAKQFWALSLKPKLNKNTHIDIPESEKNKKYPETAIIHNVNSGRILKLDTGSLFVIRKLDGKKTLNDIYMVYIDELGLISPNKLGIIYETLEEAGLLEKPDSEEISKKTNFMKKIILAMFIFYCDVSSSWNFPKKIQRIMVSLGGPISSIGIFGVLSWIYYFASNPYLTHFLAIMLGMLLFSIIMNFNPFIKMDAYYILMDLVGYPNIREESFKYIKEKLLGIFSKRKSSQFFKILPRRLKIIFGYTESAAD